jgi:hypothetical protein
MSRQTSVRGQSGNPLETRRRRARLEREKGELRSERDRVLLDLAESLGLDGLAQSLGTSSATAEKLLAGARGRILAAPPAIAARRRSEEQDRWAEADRLYETLGRDARLPGEPRRAR